MPLLPRVMAVPAAIIALAGIPALVSQGLGQSNPTPLAATVAIGVVGDSGGTGHPILLSVVANGPPPTEPWTIVDTTGLHAATVTPETQGSCAGKPVHSTGVGTTPWCLEVTDVDAGHTLTGTVTTPDTKLTLSLTRRNSFFVLPFVVLLAGFTGALLVVGLSLLLKTYVAEGQLQHLLDENRRMGAEAIQGLDEWVAARRQTMQAASLVGPVADAVHHGRADVMQAREELSHALDLLPAADRPQAAVTEAGRKDVNASDVLDDAKGTRIPPAADALRQKLEVRVSALDVTTRVEPSAPVRTVRRGRLLPFVGVDWKLIRATVLTAVVVLVALGVAGVGAWQSAFASKPAFAGFGDYFALFAAAFGSSAAAAVVPVLALWWRPKGSTPSTT